MIRTNQKNRANWTYGAALGVMGAVMMSLHAVAAAEKEAEVEVRTVHPQMVIGRLVSFSLQQGAVVQTGVDEQRIPASDIIRITKRTPGVGDRGAGVRDPGSIAPEPWPPVADPRFQVSDPDHWTIVLTWGDLLSGRILDSHGKSDDATVTGAGQAGEARPGASMVVMETADLGEVAVPIESVSRVYCPKAAVHRDAMQWLERGRPGTERGVPEDDRVLLTNGDALRGFISAIKADGIEIDTGTGPTTAPYRLVVGARLAPAIPADTPVRGTGRPPQPYLRLTLRDGAKLTATNLELGPSGAIDSFRWEMRLRIGTTIRGDGLLGPIERVEFMGGRWEWLSDHRPLSYEQSPMLGPGWEYMADRNVRNGPILVAGERYERGIGVHSRSNLIFELNGEYREFVTSFGMDDDSGPMADVTVVVLVDGQRRFEKTGVRRGALFGPIRVDVSRAGRMELRIEYGENGDLQDRFDWVEPGLIRN